MNRKAMNTLAINVAFAAAVLAPLSSAVAHGDPPQGDFNLQTALSQARKATSKYTELQAAIADGYVKFPDVSGDCVAQPGQGAMGIHYLNASLLDHEVDPLRPAMLVYRATPNGGFELVALEYVVFQPVWDEKHAQPPVLFGHPFHLVRTPNRYNTQLPLYELHVWLWEHNPNGLFNDWNPMVSCD